MIKCCRQLYLIVLVLLWAAMPAPAQEADVGEYQVKAAFLYNFTQFVTWKDVHVPDASAGFRIGILGDDPFGQTLDEVLAGESVRSLPVRLKRSDNPKELDSCQLVFVAAQSTQEVKAAIAKLSAPGILLVGEHPEFAKMGGGIQLVVENSRVNFILNMRALRSAGLDASSKLQRIAKQVME